MSKKHNHAWLKAKKDKELNDLYQEYNTIISKTRGMAANNRLEGGYKLKEYNEAVKNRSRILTLMNQRRHETQFREGLR